MKAHTSEHGPHARVGDEIVVGGPSVGKAGRDGEVVGLHHDDGTPALRRPLVGHRQDDPLLPR
ncbi:DUF1918 domain-containing protein [Streptomyces sp. KS 21]|uniref:DUF1918 domain-containing protein n=1 Tax=Streptomyces sp. KS 21 TaxID=2485150 RepID=UPI0010D149F2|nr:uncharacterized protein DUF1918 [Streptomyces sp. KS 21]